jgi:hypothetical protein
MLKKYFLLQHNVSFFFLQPSHSVYKTIFLNLLLRLGRIRNVVGCFCFVRLEIPRKVFYFFSAIFSKPFCSLTAIVFSAMRIDQCRGGLLCYFFEVMYIIYPFNLSNLFHSFALYAFFFD